MLNRRMPISRRPSGSRIAQPATIEAILGSNLIDIWYPGDALLVSGEVASVTGRRYGLVMPAPSAARRPGYSASNATFNGAPTINSSRANGGRQLNAELTPHPGFLPVGSRPFMFAVTRCTTPGAIDSQGGFIGISDFDDRAATIYRIPSGDKQFMLWDGAARNSFDSAWDAVPHIIGTYMHAVTGSALFLDGQLVNINASGTSEWNSDPSAYIGFGGSSNGGGIQPEDAEFAIVGLCRNPPTLGELASLYAYAKVTYGVP